MHVLRKKPIPRKSAGNGQFFVGMEKWAFCAAFLQGSSRIEPVRADGMIFCQRVPAAFASAKAL